MSYMVCEECGLYFKLNRGESAADFKQCECGGNLKYKRRIKPLKKDPIGIIIIASLILILLYIAIPPIIGIFDPSLDIEIDGVYPSLSEEYPADGLMIVTVENNTKSVEITGKVDSRVNVSSYIIITDNAEVPEYGQNQADKNITLNRSESGYFSQKIDLDPNNDTYFYIETNLGNDGKYQRIQIKRYVDPSEMLIEEKNENRSINIVKNYKDNQGFTIGYNIQALNKIYDDEFGRIHSDIWYAYKLEGDNYEVVCTIDPNEWEDSEYGTYRWEVNLKSGKFKGLNNNSKLV